MNISNNKFDTNKFNKNVFIGSSTVIMFLLILSVLQGDQLTSWLSQLQSGMVESAGWFYVLSVAIIFTATLYLALSSTGRIRLGPDHAKPDYSTLSWLAMLFSAGMGIGLMFFGVAEPVMHYLAPPTAPAETIEAVQEAMKTTFFHWGIQVWAVYALVALILAYFSFRQGLPLTLRSALHPIIGDKIFGWQGDIVDTFAIIGTVFGVATSLGYGVLQLSAGLQHLFAITITPVIQVIIIAVVIFCAVLSVLSGLDKGIKRLSEINMSFAIGLLLLVLVIGPTTFLLQAYVQNTGAYLSDLVRNTFNLFAYKKTDWVGGWTIFYWAWWLSWSPFVGLFIARISRGRTIRDFLVGVMLIPSGFTFAWMTVFGNSAIELIRSSANSTIAHVISEDSALALFAFLDTFPFSQVLTFIALVMVVVFFVTSCDSGAMVVNMLSNHGENNTPVWQRLYWTLGIGFVAGLLLFLGGLEAIQTMTILGALPFTVVLLISLVGLFKAMNVEASKQMSMNVASMLSPHLTYSQDWKKHLAAVIASPTKREVQKYIEETVKTAMLEVKQEMQQHHVAVEIVQEENAIRLQVDHGDRPSFVYAVKNKPRAYVELTSEEANEQEKYFRAEVYLLEGGQDYDIMRWPKESVLNDIVEQYQRHVHFLHLLN